MNPRLLALGLVLAMAGSIPPAVPANGGTQAATEAGVAPVLAIDFTTDIQPIFQRHCLECHGPSKQRSSYRLDHRETARRGGESGHPAIVPGEPEASHLLRWVGAEDPEHRMPPKGDPLSAPEIRLLRSWIAQGAPWPDAASVRLADPSDWWSLHPLVRPPVPPPAFGAASSSHPIDRFIEARLARNNLQPSPAADRRTLIRRLHFDLLGLPPTPEEVDAFVTDPGPRAYERLVDRLLASPHYGERRARQWLDVVHYGDTHGYDKDKPRPNAWPYRDYVIRAFNEDKPYERFIREQLAGDVFYPDTADGIEALGFIAAGPWDFIGHEELPESKTDGRIARHLDRDDMVANTMGTFVSLTVHCAQCHDHKFDPIPQEDYYRLQAVFAAVDRTERRYYRERVLNQQRNALESRLRSLTRRQSSLEKNFREAGGEALKELDDRLAATEKAATASQPPEYGYHSAIATRPDEAKWVQVDLGTPVALQRIVLAPCRDRFNNIGDGFGFPPRFRLELAEDPDFRGTVWTVADHTSADVPNPGIRQQTFELDAPRTARWIRVTATRLASRQNDYIFALAELEAYSIQGTNVARGAPVTALDSIEAPERWALQNLTDGKAPGTQPSPAELDELRTRRDALIAQRVPESLRSELASVKQELSQTRQALDAMPSPLVAYVGAIHYGSGNFRGTGPDEGRPRKISLLARGNVNQPIREVDPGALRWVASSAGFPAGDDATDGARRAALARWIIDRTNPLTWRSIVNRVWQDRFGRGLVETPNDFGRMGALPTHPGLLDWLAVEFRDGGQSFKSLDRLLVLSATYRQRSWVEPPVASADADNRQLARMNARRLDAEAVRDSLLAVSGRLDTTMYGPGFQDFVIEKPDHSPHYQYHLADPDDPRTHRRSIYRFLVRSQQEPMMVALDCADPSMRVDRRNETLTPLQALALLNSRLVVALSGHFADRVRREAGDAPAGQVRRAFQLALQRAPSPEEFTDLQRYVERHGLPAACRLLFNLNEFVFVD